MHGVLVHHCSGSLDDDGCPLDCNCRLYIPWRKANGRVMAGVAVWRMFKKPNGKIVVSNREILIIGKLPREHARTISHRDILVAFVLDDEVEGSESCLRAAAERRRIKTWHEFIDPGKGENP